MWLLIFTDQVLADDKLISKVFVKSLISRLNQALIYQPNMHPQHIGFLLTMAIKLTLIHMMTWMLVKQGSDDDK